MENNKYPNGLRNAQEACKDLYGLTPERLIDLAQSGYAPHYFIDGKTYLFKQTEIKQWVSDNLMQKVAGRSLPKALRVCINAPKLKETPPRTISFLDGLQQIPIHEYQPGVYFLCKNNEVVYVGQSLTPSSRVSSHTKNKDFDTVYLLPVPKSELDEVESAFIHLLNPILQGRCNGKNSTACSPISKNLININEITKKYAGAI